jgi:hypothetical protein
LKLAKIIVDRDVNLGVNPKRTVSTMSSTAGLGMPAIVSLYYYIHITQSKPQEIVDNIASVMKFYGITEVLGKEKYDLPENREK